MSSKNAPKKDSLNRNQRRNLNREKAREQARLLKEKEEAKRKRTRIIAGCAGALLIVAVIALVVVLVKNVDDPVPALEGSDGLPHAEKIITTQPPANVTEYGGISLGKELKAGTANKGVPQVDIYFDYSCHHCSDLGNEYGTQLAEAAKKGDITLVYHPVTTMRGLFSYTGAAAEFFVAENEPDKYLAFHELLHEKVMAPYAQALVNRKEGEEVPSPTVQDILPIAKEAGLSDKTYQGLSEELTPLEDALLNDSDKAFSIPLLQWVSETTEQFVADSKKVNGKVGTPEVYIDGQKTDRWSQDIPDLLNK